MIVHTITRTLIAYQGVSLKVVFTSKKTKIG